MATLSLLLHLLSPQPLLLHFAPRLPLLHSPRLLPLLLQLSLLINLPLILLLLPPLRPPLHPPLLLLLLQSLLLPLILQPRPLLLLPPPSLHLHLLLAVSFRSPHLPVNIQLSPYHLPYLSQTDPVHYLGKKTLKKVLKLKYFFVSFHANASISA